MPTVKEVMRDWLEDNNYDGLIDPSGWCMCKLEKLMNPEFCEDCQNCRPAIEGKDGKLTEVIKEE